MSQPFLIEEVYNLIIHDGPSTYVYLVSIFPLHQGNDRVMVILDRVAIRPCADAGSTDPCLRDRQPVSTVVETKYHSVPVADYQELLHPGIYRVVLNYDQDSIRAFYDQDGLNTAPTRPETGMTNPGERDLDVEEVLDLLRKAKNNGHVVDVATAST